MRPALGRFDRVGDWEHMFRRLLGVRPCHDVVAQWWPRVSPGLFSRLTHGLIRTAHAVRGVSRTTERGRTAFGDHWPRRYAIACWRISSRCQLEVAPL